MQAAMESCPAKTVMAGGMGFALGGLFGLFMSSVRRSNPAKFMVATESLSHGHMADLWRRDR